MTDAPPMTERSAAVESKPTTQEERDFHRKMLADIAPNAATKTELVFPQHWIKMWLAFDDRLMADVERVVRSSAAVEAAREAVETALTNWRGVLTSSMYVGQFAAALTAQRAILESLDAFEAACRAEGAAEMMKRGAVQSCVSLKVADELIGMMYEFVCVRKRFTNVETKEARDLLNEYAAACRAEGRADVIAAAQREYEPLFTEHHAECRWRPVDKMWNCHPACPCAARAEKASAGNEGECTCSQYGSRSCSEHQNPDSEKASAT